MQPFRLIGLFPLGVGLLSLCFVWTLPAPIFFKLFGSLVSGFFILHGWTWLTLAGRRSGGAAGHLRDLVEVARSLQSQRSDPPSTAPPPAKGYQCAQCGAVLDQNADVSPSGDVKCSYCQRWFNIHGR